MSFDGETSLTKEKGKKLEVEEIELSLSLSLNGKFGLKKPNGKVEKMPPALIATPPLVRTCSMHVDNGEGKIKRKIEIVRKMAKRKRMERMSIVRGVRGKINGDGYGGSRSIKSRNVEDLVDGVVQESDGGSSSQGWGSSEVSDITEHQEIQVLNNSSEARNASHSACKQDEQHVADSVGNESKKKGLVTEMANRGWRHVFTTLDDPNHVKVEGFLQKYSHGRPVKIVCVCHGVYHSPAEFVKHAGGDAVENPLKQIVVTLPSVS